MARLGYIFLAVFALSATSGCGSIVVTSKHFLGIGVFAHRESDLGDGALADQVEGVGVLFSHESAVFGYSKQLIITVPIESEGCRYETREIQFYAGKDADEAAVALVKQEFQKRSVE